ncbi:prepilin-type N-terminal cleavage/methylation domain-containing protein [Halopseudomonas salina]|uniref:Pilus assembly protein PilW n=1 Tax=Halopseudomonas salina TaxID=1323744 RepID=A0ABQ1PVV1_9GAMM|nr:prepilin-type N-terminal cleavage/methylation domain-containing protein [Halopseudomonas salina]GGD04973.1 pilus assembly protein PilW [Halopseudomonas salina]
MKFKNSSKGFGLIEIMIALVLGLVLVLGITQIFASSRQTALVQDASATLQEDARYVLTRMTQELRMAGMFGCLSLASGSITNVPAAFDNPIAWDGPNATLRIITSNATQAVGQSSNADWTLVTDCRTGGSVEVGSATPPAGEIALPIRQIEYQLDAAENVLQVRYGGGAGFEPLIGNVKSLDIQFGVAANAGDTYVTGNYVAPGLVPNPAVIRSVRIALVLEDENQRTAEQEYTVVAALRNRLL